VTAGQRFTLIAAILGSTVVFLDSTVVNVALPAISEDLDAGLAGQQWVVEAYLLTLVSFMLVGGSLGDQFGRRRMFVIGLIGFAATSALCAIAPSDEFLVGARAMQGFAGALLVPGSLALVASAFEGPARGKAVGTWTAFTGIATVIGPAGGGWVVDNIDWRWIFWVNLPLIAVTILLTLRHVKESSDPDAYRGIDWGGIALSALGLAGPVFGLIEQPTYGWGDPIVWGPIVAGVACFGLFLRHEARAEHPMLDLGLFRIRNFWVVNLTTFTVYGGLIGGLFFVPLYLQQIAGYSALEAGLATTPLSVVMFFLSPRAGRMASDTGPRVLMCVGPIVAGIGMLLLLRIGPDGDYVADVLPGVLVFALGLTATVAPLTATVLDSVEERHAGVASGINNGISRVAGLLVIAALGAAISGVFGSALDDNLAGTRLSPAAGKAIDDAKRQPLGAPDTAALGAAEAERLDDAAADASTDAFRLGLAIAAILMILGGAVAGIGVVNPRRREELVAPRAATAGECGRSVEDPCPSPVPGDLGEPVVVAASGSLD
jgi:EmrB/QacA subfamily drug resistance transporter